MIFLYTALKPAKITIDKTTLKIAAINTQGNVKLFTRYGRINIAATVAIFVLASLAFSILLRYVLIDQLDDYLETEQKEIETYYEKYMRLPEPMQVSDQQIRYEKVGRAVEHRKFSTLTIYDSIDHDEELVRQLIFGLSVNGRPHNIRVSKSMEGTEELIKSILVITICTILLILIVSFLINRLVLRKLWKPFYNTLDNMKRFKLGQQQVPEFPRTRIDEFAFMNKVLSESIGKAEQDYKLLKEFTENASHELQTPLAIIRSKLDLLIQDDSITEKQSKTVESAYDAIQKMSRLNQSLLLLAKIDNRQFSDKSDIDLRERILAKQAQFKELWDSKQLAVSLDLQPVSISMNCELADILLNNLLSNATRHNRTGGEIIIQLTPALLRLANTGENVSIAKDNLFSRFYKPQPVKDSNGLGLSIIKQIAGLSGYSVRYEFAGGMHAFIISFE